MKCMLSIEINTCPFCDKGKMECKSKDKVNCAFQKNESECENKYVRKERWYEKYYK